MNKFWQKANRLQHLFVDVQYIGKRGIDLKNIPELAPIIEAIGLGKYFINANKASILQIIQGKAPQIQILNNINLAIQPGELLGVIGKNGSGKSTLLRTISGIYHCTSGEIRFHGDFSTLFEMGVFLDNNATGRKYCMDYFEFMLEISDKEAVKNWIEYVENFSELGDFFDRPVREYSSGMKARLLFAVATAAPAKVYLIDEALVVGDEYFQGKAWRRLYELLGRHASGIIVTHDTDSVIKLCNNSMLLRRGGVIANGLSHEVVQQYLGLKDRRSEDIEIFNSKKLAKEKHIHESGANLTLSLVVKVTTPPDCGIMTVSFAIEKRMNPGGWLHICKFDKNLPVPHRGHYYYNLEIKNLTLAEGNYHCTFTLADPPASGEGAYNTIYDEQKWIQLDVQSERAQPAVGLQKKVASWNMECI